jgi:hypothetical protein
MAGTPTHLELVVFVEEQVLGLDVAVVHTSLMAVLQMHKSNENTTLSQSLSGCVRQLKKRFV